MSDDLLAAAAAKPGRLKGRCVGGTIEIEAPVDVVWSIAGDWQGWDAWNELYTRTGGEPREGASIDFTVAVPGLKPVEASATVYSYRPNETFEYGLSAMGGLNRAFRFVDVEEIAPDRTRLSNGEIMGGPIGFVLSRLLGSRVGQGLRTMNARVKELAEAKAAAAKQST